MLEKNRTDCPMGRRTPWSCTWEKEPQISRVDPQLQRNGVASMAVPCRSRMSRFPCPISLETVHSNWHDWKRQKESYQGAWRSSRKSFMLALEKTQRYTMETTRRWVMPGQHYWPTNMMASRFGVETPWDCWTPSDDIFFGFPKPIMTLREVRTHILTHSPQSELPDCFLHFWCIYEHV